MSAYQGGSVLTSCQAEGLAADTSIHGRAGSALQMVCALVTPVPVLMLAMVLVLRRGFLAPTPALVKMAGLSLLVLNVAGLGSMRRWLLSGPALVFATLIGISLIGLSPGALSLVTGWVIAGAGLLAALWNLGTVARNLGLLRTTALLVLGLALGAYAGSTYWRSESEHLIVYPEAMLSGQVHADVLEQAAIVKMIDTYSVASTGLDGLVRIKYHTGSLWVAQALRRLCGLQALEFIAFGYGLLLVPLYVAGIFCCGVVFRIVVQGNSERSPPLTFWIAGALAVFGLFPLVNDPNHWNFNATILNNDSLLFVFALSAWLMAIAAMFYRCLQGSHQFTLSQKLGVALVLPGALALIGFVKISQIYMLLALPVYLCWRIKWLRTWPALLGLALAVSVAAAEFYTETGAVTANFSPLHFDRIHPEWVPYFFVVYFLWAWLFLFLWARVQSVNNLADMVQATRTGTSLPVEILFVTVIAGLAPYLLVDFHAPNWMFFTQFHAVVAGIFTAAFVPRISPSHLAGRLRRGDISLADAFALFVAVAVCGHVLMTTNGALYRMVKSAGEARAGIAGKSPLDWRSELRHFGRPPATWSPAIAMRRSLVQCLRTLDEKPSETKRTAALYIPKTNRVYWDMRQVGQGATPFIAPAESGMAMVDGVPEFEDIGWAATGWGYPQYKLPSGPQLPVSDTEKAVNKAKQAGFRNLWVLRGLNPDNCDLEEVALGQ